MRLNHLLPLMLCAWAALPGQTQAVVNRALPSANLNNAAGAEARSNVRWSWFDEGFVGDDFRIGEPGERWVVTRMKVWAVPGARGLGDPDYLGDFYSDVRLYLGSMESGASPIATGTLELGTNVTSNAAITISEARSDSGYVDYDDFGQHVRVWEISFDGLAFPVEGGKTYVFGAYGLGRAIPGQDGATYPWFTHGSNAPLGGAAADGADEGLRLFKASGQYAGPFSSTGNGWNKSSDLNVQVFARRLAAQQ